MATRRLFNSKARKLTIKKSASGTRRPGKVHACIKLSKCKSKLPLAVFNAREADAAAVSKGNRAIKGMAVWKGKSKVVQAKMKAKHRSKILAKRYAPLQTLRL